MTRRFESGRKKGQSTVGKLIRAIRREKPLLTLRRGVLVSFPWEVGYARFLWLTRLGKKPARSFDKPDDATRELQYSGSYLSHYRPDRRVQWTMFLLASIPDCRRDSLLIIGPRYEPELLMARGLGWSHAGVRGLDTFSYSPLVDTGDMHDMPYEDESFSSAICSWTLSYSSRPDVAAKEMTRVLKPGGYLVVAVQKVSSEYEDVLPDVPHGPDRIQTLAQLDALYVDLVRVAGFESALDPHVDTHTIAAYRKPERP